MIDCVAMPTVDFMRSPTFLPEMRSIIKRTSHVKAGNRVTHLLDYRDKLVAHASEKCTSANGFSPRRRARILHMLRCEFGMYINARWDEVKMVMNSRRSVLSIMRREKTDTVMYRLDYDTNKVEVLIGNHVEVCWNPTGWNVQHAADWVNNNLPREFLQEYLDELGGALYEGNKILPQQLQLLLCPSVLIFGLPQVQDPENESVRGLSITVDLPSVK